MTSEFGNVGDACGDAYAMSHLSAEACTRRLAAGRGDGYQLAAATAAERPNTGRICWASYGSSGESKPL